MTWYLDQLEKLVPRGDAEASLSHPKISTTVRCVSDAWEAGEKVVVFCHYIATGKTLRNRISEAVDRKIRNIGAMKLGCKAADVPAELDRIGNRFFVDESPIRKALFDETMSILQQYPQLKDHTSDLMDIVRRNARTPAFLVRFFPLRRGRWDASAMTEALDKKDRSGQTLRMLLEHFFQFLVERCGAEDRRRYINAVKNIQTGRLLRFGRNLCR